jgi:hypothetical protein
MDKPVTQICPDSLEAIQPISPAPTPAPVSKGAQGQPNHKIMKCSKQRGKQDIPKHALLDHAENLHHGSYQTENLAAQSPVIKRIKRGSPWDKLKDLFTCDLAGPVSIAVHDKSPSEVVAVRAFSKKKADTWLQVLQRTQHPNAISAKEILVDRSMTYYIVDDLPLTLEHLVTCHIFPSELQLASILGQVWGAG